MSEWKPIKTAPRDSTTVLIYIPRPDDPTRRTVFEAWWAIPYEAAPNEQGWWQTVNGVTLDASIHKGYGTGKPLGATHWMPLPAPPTKSERQE